MYEKIIINDIICSCLSGLMHIEYIMSSNIDQQYTKYNEHTHITSGTITNMDAT